MPYSDPEKRRQFQREYKRRWRKGQEKINPLRMFKIYLCERYPNMYIPGGGNFFNGSLITNDQEVQARVEAHPEFWKTVFPLCLDYSCIPRTETEEED